MSTRGMAILALIGGVAASAALARPYLLQQATTPVPELVNHGLVYKAVYAEHKRSGFFIHTADQEIVVRRRERENQNSPWFEHDQILSASYFIVDARAGCPIGDEIRALYVVGSYPTGDSCIEKWTFSYKVQSGAYVPINQRPPPTVKRTELLRTSSLGIIGCVEPDPSGRFVLFLTRGNVVKLYQLDVGSAGPALIANEFNVPELARMRSIVARRHQTEGRQFHLLEDPRWEAAPSDEQTVIILRDPEDDGLLASPDVVSMNEWHAVGYAMPGPWIETCQ